MARELGKVCRTFVKGFWKTVRSCLTSTRRTARLISLMFFWGIAWPHF